MNISSVAKQENMLMENTLEEPILETVMRDVRMIGYKLKYVLMPKMQEDKGKDLRKCIKL